MNLIKIANKLVGEENPCFIIAEAGVNHNGKINIAKKMVDSAKASGADAIKFQIFKSEQLVTKNANMASYANKNMGKKTTQLDFLKKVELKYEDFHEIKKYCDKKNILFLSTPHSFDAIDFLEKIVPAYKFGSGDLTNIPALEYASKKNKPIILGTGMATLEEIKYAVNAIKNIGNKKIVVLHCTTNYPCPMDEVNMNAMLTLKKELDCLVGYSDHTMGITASIMARTLGAIIIEKHFTLDNSMLGPDHKASLEPVELKRMVKEIRNVEKALGSFEKKPTKSEGKIKKDVRKSIVANIDIEKNEKITIKMIKIKRPGYGIEPFNLKKIIGKTVNKKINEDEVITWDMIE